MPTFTREDVRQLASLARLALSDDEAERFAGQLGDILAFVREIQAVDTSAVAAPSDALTGALRDDTVRPSLDRDEIVNAAPGADEAAGLFKVPRVLTG